MLTRKAELDDPDQELTRRSIPALAPQCNRHFERPGRRAQTFTPKPCLGNTYLDREFSLLDKLIKASIVMRKNPPQKEHWAGSPRTGQRQ